MGALTKVLTFSPLEVVTMSRRNEMESLSCFYICHGHDEIAALVAFTSLFKLVTRSPKVPFLQYAVFPNTIPYNSLREASPDNGLALDYGNDTIGCQCPHVLVRKEVWY